MPSSLIFVGLVVLWLLILVPTVARRQQEVARLSPALLSGRVLERPMRHRYPEVGQMERSAPSTVGELVETRGDVPGQRDHDADRYDEFDAEIDDDGRVYGLDDDLEWDGRERDPRPATDREGDGPGDADLELDEQDRGDRSALGDRRGDPEELDDRADRDDDRDDGDSYDRTPDDRLDDTDHDDDADLDHDDHLDHDGPHDELDEEEDRDPPARYRPGRGGFDPEAAAATAHAKYTFRQRVVLALLVLLLAAGATALLVSTVFWWVAGALGVGLVGYLTYLRRQVRIEESIRARRAARLTGARRAPVEEVEPEIGDQDERDTPAPEDEAADEDGTAQVEDEVDWTSDDGEPSRVRGTGEPLGVLPARRRTVEGPASTEHESSLPRLAAAPPPPVPTGTSLVDVNAEEEPDVLDDPITHRRAVGE
ncbi:divisome protein SepX/GlpR [Pseudonocardia parietis]|uniref:Uncharacterized protein n=1 Tax=Pseudonocardia parietis TaxID=570936 RepID=A0ABS4W481_9PSEU|nr:gephyrin-like molybdotransferase receptor GlpR [Pseudonocardia parietis]MBP2371023.1 hypothetical protein [Pseudonocardia parietis]